jgi:transposase, IS5 family
MAKAQKSRASKASYVSPNQLELIGFESPFTKHLNPNNRWVKLAKQIPWDKLFSVYNKQLNNRLTGANGINPRVAIGAVIIKHLCDLSDRETVLQLQENVYMQYFIGYSGFSDEPVFDPSLFVDLRKRFGADQINEINETIMGLVNQDSKNATKETPINTSSVAEDQNTKKQLEEPTVVKGEEPPSLATDPLPPDPVPANKGELIVDATACPQDISYPTDLNLINDARAKSEMLIDILYRKVKLLAKDKSKPRTYRRIARKEYLKVAQKKHKTKAEIRSAIRKQLSYLNRNIRYIKELLQNFERIPLKKKSYKYFHYCPTKVRSIFYTSLMA